MLKSNKLDKHTCGHVLQHLQQHVLSFINQFSSLNHQLPQAEVSIQHGAHETALKVTFYRLHFHKGGQQA